MLTTLTRENDVLSAYIIKGRLEAEGIPVFVQHANFMQTYSMATDAMGGVDIKVNSQDLDDATVVLRQIESSEFQLTEPEIESIDPTTPDLTPECPRCHSQDDILYMPGRRLKFLIMAFLMKGGVILLLPLFLLLQLINLLLGHTAEDLWRLLLDLIVPGSIILLLISLIPIRLNNRHCRNCSFSYYEKIPRPLSGLKYLVVFVYTNLVLVFTLAMAFAVFLVLLRLSFHMSIRLTQIF